MIVSAMEFTSAAECIAHAAAVRARCFNPKTRPVAKPLMIAAPVMERRSAAPTPVRRLRELFVHVPKPIDPNAPIPRNYANQWEIHPTYFDRHVAVWRRHLLAMEMAECPDFIIEPDFDDALPILDIVLEVLTAFPGISVEDVRSHKRGRRYSVPRHMAVYEVRKRRPEISLPQLGRWFGGRDHTSILHADRKIKAARGEA